MEQHSKLQIYKGIIQYLLESTYYTLKNVADLSNTSIKDISSIYYRNRILPSFKSELQLVKLFNIILEINMNKTVASQRVDVYHYITKE